MQGQWQKRDWTPGAPLLNQNPGILVPSLRCTEEIPLCLITLQGQGNVGNQDTERCGQCTDICRTTAGLLLPLCLS